MTVLLEKGPYQVDIDPQGAYVTRMRHNGRDILFPLCDLQINGITKRRGGMHLCMPNFGPSPTSGRSKHLPQHGFMRDVRWNVYYQTDECVLLDYTHDADEVFLYDFKICLCIRIAAESLEYLVMVKHLGMSPVSVMPACLGVHPYFDLDQIHQLATTINGFVLCKTAPQETTHTPFEGKLGLIAFTRYNCDMKTSDFHHVVEWSDDVHARYFCLEPVMADPSHFATPYGVWLESDKPYYFSISFDIKSRD